MYLQIITIRVLGVGYAPPLYPEGVEGGGNGESVPIGGSVVQCLGRRACDREVASSTPSRCTAGAFHPPGIDKSSTSLLAGAKAGRVHLCRVAMCDPMWQVTSRSCEMVV